VLDSQAADVTQLAQRLLDVAAASAVKPGAPREALPLTYRGYGYIHASTASLDKAAAA
jgi:hypothetical protein